MRRSMLILTPLLLAAGIASAADAPARKSGLWEITTNMSGPMPMAQTAQQCIDEKTDKLTEQGDMKEMEKHCSKNTVTRSGNKVISDSICKFDGTTATTHGEFTGDFGSNYRGDVKTTYNPPMHGMSGMQMSISAKWLGPCKPGMKPGDIIMQGMPGMPGGMKFNAADMQKQMMK
ncbi:MAG: DUF3617 family protein [Zoogloeaceae bacterium]|nr:DUF3617 family protein [Zoogloeaceae bacterium]